MRKYYFFLVSAWVLLLCGCRKTEEHPLTLHATIEQSTKGLYVHWNQIQVGGFKRVVLYRSSSNIPDPTLEKPIPSTLQIASLSDASITGFADTLVNFSQHATWYYKVVIYFKDRFMVSNQVEFSLDMFSVPASGDVTPFPQMNLVYFYAFPTTISVLDYTQKK